MKTKNFRRCSIMACFIKRRWSLITNDNCFKRWMTTTFKDNHLQVIISIDWPWVLTAKNITRWFQDFKDSKMIINRDCPLVEDTRKNSFSKNVHPMSKKSPRVSLFTSRCSKSLDFQIILSPEVCTDCNSSLIQEGII